MSERALLERFDLVAENPENIPLLRRYIVDLAVRGKLLEKAALDISAAEMLKHIEGKADLLIKQGQLKKQKPLDPIGVEEIPAAYAAHCTFERLGNVANLQKGQTGIQSTIPGEFPLVVTAAARSTCDHYDFDGAAAIVPLVSSTGHGHASLNRLHYQEGKFALGTILCAVFPIDEELISARFIFEYLTAFKDELLVSKMNGTANVTLTVGKIAEVPVPIIAPAVQQRVDELMALCDQLVVAKNEREARRDRLVAASLHRIGTAPAVADEAVTEAQNVSPLRDATRFHLDHLPRLTTRPEHIKQLRQTILNLAVRGRLVPQDPNEEAAAELLKQRVPEKNDATPFLIPATWVWVTAGEIAKTRLGKMLDKAKNKGTPRRYLRNVNVRWFDFNLSDVLEMRFEDSELDEFALYEGDVLICEGGEPGRAAVWDAREDGIYFQKAIHRLRFPQGVNPNYFVSAIREAADSSRLATYFTGVGIKHFTGKGLASFLFPLPPLAEQHRIVAKVDELMALCNQLEAQLTATQTDSRRLLEAVLHESLAKVA